ncbi:hypothetical protein [Mycolicibacterium conceptionense]|uniref:hypothetical protein n=1 Tax=Mycolicibacterium conceptionense TaxID=451644 RepID=UPI000AD4E870|nr:hypothetical protein [Mycolicibacterium conceptionense]
MSAVPSTAHALTRSKIEEWSTAHLSQAAPAWRQAAVVAEGAFEQHRKNIASPGGTTWEGDAKDAALDRVTTDTAVVRSHGEVLRAAADIAESAAADIATAKREVLDAITAAENDGFTVGEDLSVTDARRFDINAVFERNRAAKEHAEDIRWYAERLVQTDAFAGHRLQEKAAELEGIRFEGERTDGSPDHVQLVSNEFKLHPQDDPDDPWSPHPDYPNRTKNGKYGKGNSRDGKAAEKAALDKREEDTGIPIVRQQVRATHPDVRHPDGTPQYRYFDGLEPTGNPDEYIGIEAKINEGALDRDQQVFDAQVSRERPATATLNGRPIKIVGAEVEYPPEGWVPPSEQPGPGAGASAGATEAGPAPVGPNNWGGVEAEGTVPVTGPAGPVPGSAPVAPAPGSVPVTPSWGTHLTPQEMIDSGDPALRVAGEEIRRQMQANGQIDPSGIA